MLVVVPFGFTTAAIIFPAWSTVISIATLAFSLKSSSKLGSLVILLPLSPLLILTPLPSPPFPLAALPL
ncbi:MAG: hypothetical protein NTY72_13355 [Bacteroidetes bacterium]|nr:hypothetical protein [Bacteroidota bacterium]